MKTVSGKILSQKPVSEFGTTDNGASLALSAYLRRSLASFKELRHVEKELGAPRFGRKHKRPVAEIVSEVDGVQKKQTRTVVSDREIGVNVGRRIRERSVGRISRTSLVTSGTMEGKLGRVEVLGLM